MGRDGRERIIAARQELAWDDTVTEAYDYTGLDRLRSWQRSDSTWGGVSADETYTYDDSGNMASRSGTLNATYAYDAEDRLTTATVAGEATTFAYDEFGRMTARSGAQAAGYTWDSLTRLRQVRSQGATTTLTYTAAGLPATRVRASAGATTTTSYFFAGGQLAAQRNTDGTLLRFLYAPDGTPTQVLVTMPDGTRTTFAYHTDTFGSVVAITDEWGGYAARYAYDPWGRVIQVRESTDPEWPDAIAACTQPLRYRGYLYDADLALYILPARVYDPALARFLSPDPANPSAGEPRSLNRYAYCMDDPINLSDPSGAIAALHDAGSMAALARAKARIAKEAAARKNRINRFWAPKFRRSKFEVVSTPVFNNEGSGMNHVYVRSTDPNARWGLGANGSSGGLVRIGDGKGTPDGPTRRVWLPRDMKDEEFMAAIDDYEGWDSPDHPSYYCPVYNDCHTQLEGAFAYAGVPYPGSPYGRTDWQERGLPPAVYLLPPTVWVGLLSID